jgi:hypothetical protein
MRAVRSLHRLLAVITLLAFALAIPCAAGCLLASDASAAQSAPTCHHHSSPGSPVKPCCHQDPFVAKAVPATAVHPPVSPVPVPAVSLHNFAPENQRGLIHAGAAARAPDPPLRRFSVLRI